MVLHPLDAANPDPPPFMIREGRARVGLRLVEDSQWLHRDGDYDAQIALKSQILGQTTDSVRCEPSGERAADELLGLVEASTRLKGNSGSSAIDATGRLVQEDLCVLDGESLRLIAGSVCFPQGWLLSDKIGLSMRGIHEPVAHYGPLAEATDSVVEALDTRARCRTNWFVVGDDRLRAAPGTQPEEPMRLHLRFERQCLRRLPATGAIVFTIRTYLSPLSDIDDRPELQRGLLLALGTMTSGERAYHGNEAAAEMAKDHLRDRAAR